MTLKGRLTVGMATALVFGVAVSGVALAQGTGRKAADQRHENFEQLGKTFKILKDELANDAPDKATLIKASASVKDRSLKLPHWFPKGSGKEVQPKSEALPGIWTDPAGFNAAATKLQVEAGKLATVAASGNVEATRAQFQTTGQACGGCHKVYREKKS